MLKKREEGKQKAGFGTHLAALIGQKVGL